ncbi:hypothetical protein D3C78_982240 [compost metagenome]
MTLGLPKDVDEMAAQIKEKQYKEQNAVLSDLRTYYKAYNEENLDLTLQYTSPLFMEDWSAAIIWGGEWEESLKAQFELSDARYKLSEERVIFLGEKEAVVHGKLEWSDASDGVEPGDHVFEALIYMDYANGHWNYSKDIDINQN